MKKNIWLLIAIFLGIIYIVMYSVSIEKVALKQNNIFSKDISLPFESRSDVSDEAFIFKLSIYSKIAQDKKLHITADDEIVSIMLNNTNISFEDIKQRYKQNILKDYKRGYDFILPLKRGENNLEVETKNYGIGGYTFKAAQNYFYSDYIVIFFLLFFPLIVLLVNFLDRSMPYMYDIFSKINNTNMRVSDNILLYLPFIIIALGIIIRLSYFAIYGHSSYQHDQHYHIEFIKYFMDNWALPLPDKALEFPQQPLYYFLTGKLYAVLVYMGLSEHSILDVIASLSMAMMSLVLVISYGIIKNITSSRFILNTALAFLAFTPSLVFLAGQINNDPLNYFLSALAIYYIVLYHNTDRGKYFLFALIFSALVFLVKVSSGMISIILFIVLLRKYFIDQKDYVDKGELLLHVKAFAIVIGFFLGFSFLRVYLPSTGEFLFVNSGVFGGQEIKSLNFSYFMSFRIFDLINEGQSYVYDRIFMPVKQSFFTWQYATMLLGEYNYKKVMETLFLNRIVYFFSLIYVVGLVSFVYYFKKMPLVVKLFVPILIVNQLLIANFAFSFPSVCNTDFRYNSPSIIIWALVIASGLYQLYMNSERLKRAVIYAVVIANIVQIVWLINLLILAKNNTIT